MNETVPAITIDKKHTLAEIKNRPGIEREKNNDEHNALQPEQPPVVAPDSARHGGPNECSTLVPLANHLELCAMSDIERLKIVM